MAPVRRRQRHGVLRARRVPGRQEEEAAEVERVLHARLRAEAVVRGAPGRGDAAPRRRSGAGRQGAAPARQPAARRGAARKRQEPRREPRRGARRVEGRLDRGQGGLEASRAAAAAEAYERLFGGSNAATPARTSSDGVVPEFAGETSLYWRRTRSRRGSRASSPRARPRPARRTKTES